MKKNLILCILLIILFYLIIDRFSIQIIRVNPNVNMKVIPYISKAIKEIDDAIEYSVHEMNSAGLNVNIIYKNAYGSGFLQQNSMPNDLDYAIGINLGTYEYNGKNGIEIAEQIDRKMTLFQTEFYSYVDTIKPGLFYSDYNIMTSLSELFAKREANISSINSSLPKIFNNKDYIAYTRKTMLDEKQKQFEITFPFVLKKNEILIEDYSPIILYTNIIKYSPDTKDILRELTVVTDFYADIKKGDELVHAEIVAESFTGQRLQLTRRFFVPLIFTGKTSEKFLKNLPLLTDDETYFEYRMFNFKRHLQEISNIKEFKGDPIKLLKRILQCTDLIMPALDRDTAESILSDIEKNLTNPDIRLINDYITSLDNLIQISSRPNMYLKLQYKNKISEHLDTMLQLTEDLKNSGMLTKNENILLKDFTNNIKESVKLINSPEKLEEFYKELRKNSETVNEMLTNELINNIYHKEQITDCIDLFNKIMADAGFHKITMCWLDKDLMGIVKDEFTSKISEAELKNMARENKLADVKYKFVTQSELSGPKVRYSVWIRYNSSDDQNKNYRILKTKLIQDKKNFNIKKCIVF